LLGQFRQVFPVQIIIAKELDLRMSSSYGPGRYDNVYEEKGIDYPIGYVRFTENRNMQSFIDLLAEKKLNIDKLVTHTFNLEEAPKAYDIILKKNEPIVELFSDMIRIPN